MAKIIDFMIFQSRFFRLMSRIFYQYYFGAGCSDVQISQSNTRKPDLISSLFPYVGHAFVVFCLHKTIYHGIISHELIIDHTSV